jgi:CRISPR/Cas system-associated protein Csm6
MKIWRRPNFQYVLVLTSLSTELQIIPMQVRFSASVIRTSLIRVCAWQKCVTVATVVHCWEMAA